MRARLELKLLVVYSLGLVLLLGGILWLNEGRFSYSLDDAYIHLALAEGLASGHYGLNPGETASPSSSILWPILLAPFSALEQFALVPLAISLLSLFGVILALFRFFRERLADRLQPAALAVIFLLMAISLNFWGLPLNGMEHSLQLFLTIWVAVGLIDLVEDARVRPTFLLGLALGPLIRYENLSLLLMGALVLWLRRFRGRALLVLALPIAGIVGHTGFLRSQGLPALPSSVLSKMQVGVATTFGAALAEIGENVLESLAKDRVLAILLLAAALGLRIRRSPSSLRSERDRLYWIFLVGVAGAHMVVGRYDWLGRYEIYLMLTAAVLLLYAFREGLGALISARRRWAIAGLIFAALVVGKNQIIATAITPVSAANIYSINFQVRRLAVDLWRDSVGVTDVGLVSLDNPHYVLDLWGLGSEEARRLRSDATDNEWTERLADEHRVDLLIVDADWFEEQGPLPSSWERVGELGGYTVGHGRGARTIFLREPSRHSELMRALETFEVTLPSSSVLTLERGEVRRALVGEDAAVDPRDDV